MRTTRPAIRITSHSLGNLIGISGSMPCQTPHACSSRRQRPPRNSVSILFSIPASSGGNCPYRRSFFKRLFVRSRRLGRLSQSAIRDKPLVTEAACCGNSFVIPVVVDQGNVSFHGRSSEQQVSWRDSAMIAATSQGKLRL